MSDKSVVVVKPARKHPISVRAADPMLSLIERMAFDPTVDAGKLDTLLKMKERLDAQSARKEFNAAFSAFKSSAVEIIKNTLVKDGPLKGKKHANLFDVVNAVTPKLSAHDLSIRWNLSKDEKDWLEVTCILSHVAGHSESVSMGAGPDTGPGRNAIQARGSTKTYLERYTATAILGLASKDQDDDGRASSRPEEKKTEKPAGAVGAADLAGALADDRLKWFLDRFPKLGVTAEMVAAYIKSNLADKSANDQILAIRQVYMDLRDKKITVEKTFNTK